MASPAELVANPDWLPDAYDAQRREIHFARIDANGLRKAAFLDSRKNSVVTARASASVATIAAASSALTVHPPSLILHSAFCCSTLLARAVDVPGRAISLKEPNVLLELSNALRMSRNSASNQVVNEATRLVLRLLARRRNPEEAVVIKPTNTASLIVSEALAIGAPCLFLYGDLRSFMRSLLKKGEQGRAFARQQFGSFVLDQTSLAAIPQSQRFSLTDLQAAALVWRHQLEQFERILRMPPKNATIASLNSKRLLANTPEALAKVGALFGLAGSNDDWRSIAEGPVFARNAKDFDAEFNAAHRNSDNKVIESQFAGDLDAIENWAATITLDCPLADAREGTLSMPLSF